MYSKVFQIQANILKAVAHPRRLEIIHLLRDQELPVSDIHMMLDLPQANISQHLMILREAAIVKTRREGKQIYYKLSDIRIIQASDLIREVLIDQHDNLKNISEHRFSMKDLVPLVHDPVCGMRVSPKTAGFHTQHHGSDVYFCASGCLKEFQRSPEKYMRVKK